MGKIYLNELASVLEEKHGLSRGDAVFFINNITAVITEGIDRDKAVKIRGLGTFKVVDVDARESISINTGERMLIDSHSKITFTPDAAMKELVNKPFSHFETVVLNDGVTFSDMPENSTGAESSADVVEEPVAAEEAMNTVAASFYAEPVDVAQLTEEPQNVVSVNEEPVQSGTVDEPAVVEPQQDEYIETFACDDGQDEDEPHGKSHWWAWVLACILSCGLGFAGGFYWGTRTPSTPVTVVEAQTVEESELVGEETSEPDAPATEQEVESESEEVEEQPQEEVAQPEPEPDYKQYEAMDVRVRTGAYRIVGTKQVVTALQGDNSRRLAKRYLGDGMECYIEVYNDLKASTTLEAGQEIKIPALQWKKKSR